MVLEFYPQLKMLHMIVAAVSGAIFTLRGLLMLARSRLSKHRGLKYFSYANDTLLLTAGLMLMQLTRQYPTTHPWLSVKLGLLVVYILTGILAFRAASYRWRAGFFLVALGLFLFIVSVARSHNPLGLFAVG